MLDKKYNILMVSKNIPQTYKGGIQTHTYELSKQLIKNGHSVSILMSGSLFSKNKIEHTEGIKLIRVPYLPGRYIPILRLFLDELFFNISAYFWLLRNSKKFDIIHLQGRSGFLYSLFPTNTPYVATYHGLVSKEQKAIKSENLSLQYKLFYFVSNYIERFTLKKSKNLIVVSNSLKQDIIGITNKNKCFTVIPNGVNIPDVGMEDTSKINIITFIGRVEKTKGVKDLVDAIGNIDSNIKCAIIGDGEYKKELTELVNLNPKLNNKIWFLGSLTSQEVSKWISISKMIVLPSYYETQGIVLLEANAHKKPVIASNISGINEIISDGVNGLLFEKGNTKELGDKIKLLLNNNILANILGQNGFNMVKETYSWKSIVKDIEQVYKQLA
jgi:glycosyltransferase involved in cell wall biosynthesis